VAEALALDRQTLICELAACSPASAPRLIRFPLTTAMAGPPLAFLLPALSTLATASEPGRLGVLECTGSFWGLRSLQGLHCLLRLAGPGRCLHCWQQAHSVTCQPLRLVALRFAASNALLAPGAAGAEHGRCAACSAGWERPPLAPGRLLDVHHLPAGGALCGRRSPGVRLRTNAGVSKPPPLVSTHAHLDACMFADETATGIAHGRAMVGSRPPFAGSTMFLNRHAGPGLCQLRCPWLRHLCLEMPAPALRMPRLSKKCLSISVSGSKKREEVRSARRCPQPHAQRLWTAYSTKMEAVTAACAYTIALPIVGPGALRCVVSIPL
jgi:hypothetical protein